MKVSIVNIFVFYIGIIWFHEYIHYCILFLFDDFD